MWMRIDPHSSVPMYQQIIDAVKEAVAKGIVKPGDRLLTVRELASELAINHNTVAKAYQELEREQVIELVRGRGTFISQHPTTGSTQVGMEDLRAMMVKLFVEAHHHNVSDDELVQLFIDTLHSWKTENGGDSHGNGP